MLDGLMKFIGIIYLLIQSAIIFFILLAYRNNIYKIGQVFSRNTSFMVATIIVFITYAIFIIKK